MYIKKIFWFISLTLCMLEISGLIGFDCKHKDVEYSAVSVKQVAECDEVKPAVHQSKMNIQLLQKRRLSKVPYISCYTHANILITHCGMHSHASVVAGGLSQRIEQYTSETCRRAFATKTVILFGTPIDINSFNTTITGSIIPYGSVINNDASCIGTSFAYNGNHYRASVMQVSYEIILKTGYGTYDSETGIFNTGLGSYGDYKEGVLLDRNFGYVFWKTSDNEDCSSSTSYLVLYEGPAEKLVSERDNRSIIVVEQQSTTFSLQLREPTLLCSQHAFNTEHDQLKIITSNNRMFFFKRIADSLDINLSTYINAKFVYVERHLRANIETLYEDVMKFRCRVTRQTLTNLLSLASIDEDEFAYAYMGRPGYTSVKRGEVAYLIKCVPTYITLQSSTRCYNDVVISHNNKTKFLASKTNIIQDFSEEVECSQLTPVLYELQGKWYNVYPSPIAVPDPIVLNPNREREWEYKSPNHLSKSGIYSQESIESWQQSLMLASSQSALTKIITSKFIGKDIDSQGSSIHTYIDEDIMAHITTNFFVKAWGVFSNFGQIMSGLLGFIIIGKLFKLVVDSIMNGIALYRVYGFSIALMGCIWDNVAHLLISFRKKDKKPTAPSKEDLCDNQCEPPAAQNPLLTQSTPVSMYPNVRSMTSHELQ
ncbi:putative glycoprotein [Hubei odonate virus 11]|uniref:Putative glycoprotein n=1 Tax=Hubei odonate virus 11 TaxID=1922992 RepID=A0A1L3KMR2_9VIRU|nr:putative glycoprotein [Hubei odonate virus 11]APG78701.1 putative glycoprotein [Hubei odonate virus 11]